MPETGHFAAFLAESPLANAPIDAMAEYSKHSPGLIMQ
jgi:hypothetical protein